MRREGIVSDDILETLNFFSVLATVAHAEGARIVKGITHSCAVLTNGKAMCWVYNRNGNLGNGTTSGFRVRIRV